MLALLHIVAVLLAIACAVVMYRMGEPSSLWWWPWAVFIYLWNVSPLAFGVIAATRVRQRPFTIAMIAFLLVSATIAAILCDTVSRDPISGMIFLFLPVYEWGALIVLLMVASRIGWLGAK